MPICLVSCFISKGTELILMKFGTTFCAEIFSASTILGHMRYQWLQLHMKPKPNYRFSQKLPSHRKLAQNKTYILLETKNVIEIFQCFVYWMEYKEKLLDTVCSILSEGS